MKWKKEKVGVESNLISILNGLLLENSVQNKQFAFKTLDLIHEWGLKDMLWIKDETQKKSFNFCWKLYSNSINTKLK